MIRVRPYRPEDAPALAGVFRRAVLEGAAAFYTPAERAAWASGPEGDWHRKLSEQITLVAETETLAPAGFMTLGHDQYLDLAYVAPEAMGTGVAAALYDRVLAVAQEKAFDRLETAASHLARRFLLKQGWVELAEQEVERQGVMIKNFRMEKRLRRI